MRILRTAALLAMALLPIAGWAADGYVRIPAGTLAPALKYEDLRGPVPVAPFRMMQQPVTNAQFLAFVQARPEWRRDRVASVFARQDYLAHWPAPAKLAAGQAGQPVTRVSWFAASAYCAAHGARLPRWLEWEYVAAADATRRDARGDAAWRERILVTYAPAPSTAAKRSDSHLPNVYGVRDLHGAVREWVDDYSALLVSADNRDQGDPERGRFCGAGAMAVDDRDNYDVLMRIALLSSLEGADAPANLGFRCVKEDR